MATNNVEALRAAHESWNRRDFAGLVRNAAEGLVYTDNARGLKLNSRDKFLEWTEAWAKAFSDGQITNPEYIDAGDIRFAAAHRGSDVSAVLRSMSLRQTRTDCVRRVLLRSVHASHPARAHPTDGRGSLENAPHSKRRAERAFSLQNHAKSETHISRRTSDPATQNPRPALDRFNECALLET